jgi:plasmid maintenance system antidote protein VapI
MPDLIGVSALGRRVGQFHPGAKLSDAEALRLLELRTRLGLGYGKLARIFGISRSQARNIVTGNSRVLPVAWREVVK